MSLMLALGLTAGILCLFVPSVAIALWWRPAVRNAPTEDDAREIRRRRRIAIVLVILPTLCFATSFLTNMPKPDWQSGRVFDYCQTAINARVSGCFLPLILYSVVCALCILRDPKRHATTTWIRIGLAGGAVLTLQFVIVYAAMAFPLVHQLVRHPRMEDLARTVSITAWFGVTGIMAAWAVASRRMWLLRLLIVTTVALAVVSTTLCFSESWPPAIPTILTAFGIGVALLILILAPFWCLPIFLHLLAVSLRQSQVAIGARDTLAGSAWTTVYALSLHQAVTRGIALYTSLPTSPPGCFVVTAAANGHPRFVKAISCRTANGATFRVNRQLRYFKALEIAMAEAYPAAHRVIRQTYDVAGPHMASLIRHPLAADVAYLSMKPAELAICGLFRLLLPESVQTIEKLWDENERTSSKPLIPTQKPVQEAGQYWRKGGVCERERE